MLSPASKRTATSTRCGFAGRVAAARSCETPCRLHADLGRLRVDRRQPRHAAGGDRDVARHEQALPVAFDQRTERREVRHADDRVRLMLVVEMAAYRPGSFDHRDRWRAGVGEMVHHLRDGLRVGEVDDMPDRLGRLVLGLDDRNAGALQPAPGPFGAASSALDECRHPADRGRLREMADGGEPLRHGRHDSHSGSGRP